MSLALAIRAAVLLAAGAAIGRSMRSMAPASRHAVWHATIIATLALPVTSLVSPSWGMLTRLDPPPAAQPPATTSGQSGTVLPAVESATVVWIAGSGLVALYFLTGYARLWRVRRRARPAPAEWTAAVARLSARGRLTREVDVLVSPDVPGPLVTGVWSAAVVIPPAACLWSDARREAVLIHELAHVGRGDLTAQLASQVLATLHWFDPLAWYALREMRRDRELACDEAVLGAGVAPVAYAAELLAIATAGLDRRIVRSALSMARSSELEGRLSAVLAAGPRPRCRPGAAAVALALLVASISVTVSGAHLTSPAPGKGTRLPGDRTGWTILPGGHEGAAPAIDREPASGGGAARERETLILGLTPGSQVIPPLLRALDDPDARVREKAALGLAWRRDDRIGPALVAAAADPSPAVREKALVALAFSDDPRAAAVIEAARSDPDPGVRDKAHALGGRR